MSGWQPIETAPRDGTRIILWLVPGTPWQCVFGEYRLNTLFGPTWEFEDGYSIPIEGATHWQPMPTPPEDRQSSIRAEPFNVERFLIETETRMRGSDA